MNGLCVFIVPREIAKARGMTRYFTGEPCANGHMAERLTSNTGCVRCRQEYSEATKDHRAEKLKEWATKNADHKKAYMAKYHAENKERLNAQSRKYRQDNLEAIRAYDKERYAADPEKCRAEASAWREKNRNQDRANAKMNKPHVKRATPRFDCELTIFAMREAVELSHLRSGITGIRWVVDHMLPLRGVEVCGLHHFSNLQVIPWDVNAVKSNRVELHSTGDWLRDERFWNV